MRRKGIHVPRMLLNISKLLRIRSETKEKSMNMTKKTNMRAVCRGAVMP